MKRNIANVITALRIVFSILLLFCSPLSVRFVELKYYVIPVFAVDLFAAVQEGHYIRTGKLETDKF